jgi:hypothetical protein
MQNVPENLGCISANQHKHCKLIILRPPLKLLTANVSISWAGYCLLAAIIVAGCDSKAKQDSQQVNAVPSLRGAVGPNDLSSAGTSPRAPKEAPADSAAIDPVIRAKRDYLEALEQAKRRNLAVIEVANENYASATEQYQREYWATVNQYRSMTSEERASIHLRSLDQIGKDHEDELGRARQDYSKTVGAALKDYEEATRRFPTAKGEVERESIIPDSGEAELPPGIRFEYARWPSGLLATNLCAETSLGLCYPHNWKPWIWDLAKQATGEEFVNLQTDPGTEGAGTVAISWDGQRRVLFSCWRPHSGSDALVYYIVAPNARELDIVWRNESGIRYFGPNANRLMEANLFAWLGTLEK